MRERCIANVENEGKKDNKTMTGTTLSPRGPTGFSLPIKADFCTLIRT